MFSSEKNKEHDIDRWIHAMLHQKKELSQAKPPNLPVKFLPQLRKNIMDISGEINEFPRDYWGALLKGGL